MRLHAAVLESLDAVSSAVFVLRDQRIAWANSAAAALCGYPDTALRQMAFADLIVAPLDRAANCVCELLTAQGSSIWVEIALKPAEIEGEQVEVATVTDIRERKRLALYQSAITGSLEGFYLLRSQYDAGHVVDFVVEYVNAQGEAMTHFTRDQMVGQSVSRLFPIYRTVGFLDRYILVAETGVALDDDFEFPEPSGESRWQHHQVIPVEGGIAIFSRVITDRKRSESALRESEHRYRALLEQGHDGVALLDMEGRHFLVNRQLETMFGYKAGEMIGIYNTEVVAPSQTRHSVDMLEEAKAGREVPLYERVFRRKDGSEFSGEVNLTLVRDTDGKPLYVQSIIRDLTQRKQTENALRESEERYRIISELITDYAYAFRVEPDGTMVHEWITDSFRRMTGFTHDELDEAGQFALYHPDEEPHVEAGVQRALRGEAAGGEYRIITKSGELRWVYIFRQPVWDDAEQRVIRIYGVAQDITERKQSEEELRKSEEKYRLIAENSTDIIARSRTDGIRTYVSSACRSLLGYEPEELIGQPNTDVIHPDDLPAMHRLFAAIEESRDPVTFTCRVRRKSGEYGWFEITTRPMRDPDNGAILEYLSVARDIGHRKQMETILLEQQRLRYELQTEQELNEVKSNLMRTISHEFRTPLTLIITATDFLDTYIEHLDVERRQERLHAIRVQVKRLSDMLDDISFVVQGTLHHMVARPARISLEDYCRTILEEIQMTIGKSHQFVFTTDGQLQEGVADKALILRIMSNLLSNAVKYSPENSLITVTLDRDADSAILRVSDQGIGIDPEEQKHIFEPFYRGSSVIDRVGGTGLGLSIVKDCVDLLGGTISVQGAPGKGTTFSVRLPQP